jgi:hypothetical protein
MKILIPTVLMCCMPAVPSFGFYVHSPSRIMAPNTSLVAEHDSDFCAWTQIENDGEDDIAVIKEEYAGKVSTFTGTIYDIQESRRSVTVLVNNISDGKSPPSKSCKYYVFLSKLGSCTIGSEISFVLPYFDDDASDPDNEHHPTRYSCK